MAFDFDRQPLETTHKSITVLNGSFRPNGASACTAAQIRANWISSVAHTATGTYTITFKTEFKNLTGLLHASVGLRMGSGALSQARGGAIDLTNGTFVVYTFTEASDTTALADIAADADSWIDVSLHMQYAPIVDGSGISS